MKKMFLMLLSGASWLIQAQVPDPGFTIDDKTAIVITDPQNDFLSPNRATWASSRP